MKNYNKDMNNKIQHIFYIATGLIVILTLTNNLKQIEYITKLLPLIITSILVTGMSQIILQNFSGDFFEKIPLTIKIKGIKIQITLFTIITFLLEILLFNDI